MTFPKDIADHHKQNLTQKCIYMVGQFKGKDDTLYNVYKERLATLKPEDSWDFFHEMLVAYQNLSGTTPSVKQKPQPKPAAPVKKAAPPVKAPAKKEEPKKAEKKVEKKEEPKKAVKKVAKKAVKKAPAKKAAPAKKKAAPAKKAPAKKAAPKKAAKKKKK
ncbi:MAG: hypothetical protein V4598_04730 [Bdellovibrionota bacterium]